MTDSTETANNQRALKVFEKYLERLEAQEAESLDELIEHHPTLETELAGLAKAHEGLFAATRLSQGRLLSAERADATTLPSLRLVNRLEDRKRESRYELLGELGRGGMGAVLRVHDEDLNRNLAMKVALSKVRQIGDAQGTDSNTLARFLEEAQITGQLDHPGIVPVHELGLDQEGRAYFTMQLVRGSELTQVIQDVHEDSSSWNMTRALGVLLRVCEAMSYAHAKGVIHRDLKPSNIMVGEFGETYVMDWGLARVLGCDDKHDIRIASETPSMVQTARERERALDPDTPLVTMDGSVLGTPAYMPPEQARGELERIDRRSDVYSLGAVLYHLITGRAPYREDSRISAREILSRLLDGPPAAVSVLNPNAPAELAAICEKAMARNPEHRYPDTAAFRDDLRRFLERRPVGARSPSLTYVLSLAFERHRALAVTILTAGGLAAFGLVIAFSLISQARDRAESNLALANTRLDAYERMADVQRLADRERELVHELGPPWPENIPRITEWIEESREMIGRLEQHRQELARLRSKALPFEAMPEMHPRHHDLVSAQLRLQDLLEKRADLRSQIADFLDVPLAQLNQEQREERRYDAVYTEKIMEVSNEIASLEIVVNERFEWIMSDVKDQWLHDTMTELVEGLEAFEARSLHKLKATPYTSIPMHLELARRIEAETLVKQKEAWDEAIASIRNQSECPMYEGLEITPQIGLVPAGRDPDTGYWEFSLWELTGEPPQRDANGRIVMQESTGIILVLIPGGTFLMGSEDAGPGFPSVEYPSHEITLDPFFLSKYEMTQAQWEHFTGSNPSFYGKDNYIEDFDVRKREEWQLGLLPVHKVDWDECDQVLRRLGLILPTEAQWEYAARAGRAGTWWFGPDKRRLKRFANVYDAFSKSAGLQTPFAPEAWSDGFAVTSPAGAFHPNPYGLHDIIGNVFEWTRDHYGPYGFPVHQGTGLRALPPKENRDYAVRGGSFYTSANEARITYRTANAAAMRDENLGVRPARLLLP